MKRRPRLVWVRQPCTTCGAVTGEQAEKMCAPKIHCPASAITDKDGYLIEVTEESLKAAEEWEKQFA